MSSSLALRNDSFDVAGELPQIFQLASALIKAGGFLPAHLKVEGEIVAVVLAGRELGLAPMASIRGIKLVKGNVTLDASLQLALMIRAGCKIKWLEDGSKGHAALHIERAGQEPYISCFSLDDARRAGLVKEGGNWAMYPQAMLRARCISAAGKAYCPDILAGVYLPEELPSTDAFEVTQAHPIDLKTTAGPSSETSSTSTASTSVGSTPDPSPEPTPAHRLSVLLETCLPKATTIEDFVELGRELLHLHGPVRGSKGWKMFRDACANHEVSPAEAIELASEKAEAAQ